MATVGTTKDYKPTTVNIPLSMVEKLETLKKQKKVTVSKIVLDALELYFNPIDQNEREFDLGDIIEKPENKILIPAELYAKMQDISEPTLKLWISEGKVTSYKHARKLFVVIEDQSDEAYAAKIVTAQNDIKELRKSFFGLMERISHLENQNK